MFPQRYYVACPNCRTRMARTGKKTKEYRSLNDIWFYKREFECLGCGLVLAYSESRDLIIRGRF